MVKRHGSKRFTGDPPVPPSPPAAAMSNADQGLLEIQAVLKKRNLRLIMYPSFVPSGHGTFEVVVDRYHCVDKPEENRIIPAGSPGKEPPVDSPV